MAEMLFYQKAVPLNVEKHRGLRIKPEGSFAFAAQTNSVPLVDVEFVEAAREYPIVFVKGSDAEFMPVVLTGLRERENLFVDASGQWQGRYVPAFVRRYPFLTFLTGEHRSLVCVDEDADCLQQSKGLALFVRGRPSPFLTQALRLLEEFQARIPATQALCKTLEQVDLLVPIKVEAHLPDGQELGLQGAFIVDEKRLNGLEGSMVLQLFGSGMLALAHAHLLSLGNVHSLLARMAARCKH